MAKAKKEELVERVVVGPKGIHCHDKNGKRTFAKVGDTIFLPARSAAKFARYLEAPEVAAAKAKVAAAESEAAGEGKEADAGEGAEAESEAASSEEGADSAES